MNRPPVDDNQAFVQRGEGLWTCSFPLKVLGAQIGRRVVYLEHGNAGALISPMPGSRERLDRALGAGKYSVDYLIVPTGFHDTLLSEAAAEFPEARRLTSPALPPDLQGDPLPETLPSQWQTDDRISAHELAGMPKVRETLFYDARNQALIISDLFFFFDDQWDWWSRVIFHLIGSYGQPQTSRMFRAMIRDRPAFAESLRPLLDLPLRLIIPSHGRLVTDNAPEHLQRVAQAITP